MPITMPTVSPRPSSLLLSLMRSSDETLLPCVSASTLDAFEGEGEGEGERNGKECEFLGGLLSGSDDFG